ncbi:MAG: alpha/beta hydrolase [Tabrizicola sp.]|uniref:alpha/beta fold hydrolase n=1 Tax=Tabrizicola sp. TaxID=2005166 RepID=UPI002ABC196D|nr:alpha/beta hydrolase [Tabrizicola sp.]MDZ4089237.1 alpha/beta hydrolase [Tabrizicola sp.]
MLVLRNPLPPEPLVLVPGFMADARSFMPQLARFGADRPVIVLSPGLGDSIEKITADIAPHLPPRFALIAHGLGGNIAIEILRKRPDAVTRIALISTDPLPDSPPVAAEREALLVAAKTGNLAACMAQLLPTGALHDAPWRDEVMALVMDMAETLGPIQFQRHLRVLQRRPDQQKTLRKVHVPTMIIAGESDTLVPRRRAEFLAAMMPQGCLEIIAEAGHLPQLEQPEAVTKLLQTFLAGRLPTLMLR